MIIASTALVSRTNLLRPFIAQFPLIFHGIDTSEIRTIFEAAIKIHHSFAAKQRKPPRFFNRRIYQHLNVRSPLGDIFGQRKIQVKMPISRNGNRLLYRSCHVNKYNIFGIQNQYRLQKEHGEQAWQTTTFTSGSLPCCRNMKHYYKEIEHEKTIYTVLVFCKRQPVCTKTGNRDNNLGFSRLRKSIKMGRWT